MVSETAQNDQQRSGTSPDQQALLTDSVWRELRPAIQTLLFLIVVAIAYQALSASEPDESKVALAGTKEWMIWKATAAFGQAIAVTLLVAGVAKLVGLSRQVRKTSIVAVQLVAAAVFIGLMFWVVGDMLRDPRGWPIPDMEKRFTWIVGIGTACAAPWIALIWLGHRLLRDVGAQTIASLLQTWNLIASCAMAFALFVVVAIVPTGALRNLWLAKATNKAERAKLAEQFSSSDVLLYGALYGGLAVVVIIPLVLAWRSAARSLVDREYPLVPRMSADDAEARGRLETLLNLDVALIRNPLTALSILTPLITSALAAFLPELSK